MAKITRNALTGFLLLLLATYGLISGGAQAASLLPPGISCWYDDNGAPLSAGTINFDVPSSTTPKDTWNSTTQSGGTLNDNPVELDASGCAVIYGSGAYRSIVKDVDGNTIFDGLTYSSGAGSGNSAVIWGGTATGSANAQIVTAGDFNGTDGQVIAYLASATNTTTATVQTTGIGATPVVKDTRAGATALTGGEIVSGNTVMMIYTTSGGRFHLIDPSVRESAFSATKGGTNQAIAAAGLVKVTFTTEVYDVGSNFASSTWTPPKGHVTMSCGLGPGATDLAGATYFAAVILKNGTAEWMDYVAIDGALGPTSFGSGNVAGNVPGGEVTITTDDNASGTDTYECYTFSDDAAYTISGKTGTSFFQGHLNP